MISIPITPRIAFCVIFSEKTLPIALGSKPSKSSSSEVSASSRLPLNRSMKGPILLRTLKTRAIRPALAPARAARPALAKLRADPPTPRPK